MSAGGERSAASLSGSFFLLSTCLRAEQYEPSLASPTTIATSSQFTNPPLSCLVPHLPIHNSTLPPLRPVYNLSFTPQPSIMPYQCSTSPYFASPPLPPMSDTPASPVRYPPYSPPPLERGLHAPAIMFQSSYHHSDTSSAQWPITIFHPQKKNPRRKLLQWQSYSGYKKMKIKPKHNGNKLVKDS